MIANRLGNLSYPLATSMVLRVRKVLPSFTYLVELMIGIEPTTQCLQGTCSTVEPHQHIGEGYLFLVR